MTIAPTAAERAVLARLEDSAEEMAETLSALVRVPTVNPCSGDEGGGGGEAEGQELLARLLGAAGGRTETVAIPADVYARAGVAGPAGRSFEGRRNLVARFSFGRGAGPTVILNGHMDTVGAADFGAEPFSGRRQGDLVHGRGASDCKGGLVAGLFALRALAERGAGLEGRVVFESVAEEECSGTGAGTLACLQAGIRGKAAIVLDGAAGAIATGCQGVATLELEVRGRGGHGAGGGVNAANKLLLAAAALERLAAERAAARPDAAVNLGVLRAGTAPWTVPVAGRLEANLSYEHAEAAAAERAGKGFGGALVRERFEALLAEAAAGDEWLRAHPPELRWVKDAPPFLLADCPAGPAAELLAAARRGFELGWGRPAREAPMTGWSDGSHLARLGAMPVVCMGAGEPGQSHAPGEHNRVANVRRAAAAAAIAVMQLLRA